MPDSLFQSYVTNYPNGDESDLARIELGMKPKWTAPKTEQKASSKESLPKKFALEQNYPNPFNPVTRISYQLPKKGFVTLSIYDVLGEKVETLVNGMKEAGAYSAQFNGANLASGVYFYRLEVKPINGSGEFVSTKKLMLLK